MADLPSKIGRNEEEEDRISTLPDEILHSILSFVDSKIAVQTCVLSKRWVNIWFNLPSLYFNQSGVRYCKFVTDLLCKRNHESDICSMKVDFWAYDKNIIEKVIKYAISHNVKHLRIHQARAKVLDFPHGCLKRLTTLKLSCCRVFHIFIGWSLPSLTTLHLEKVSGFVHFRKFDFPALKALHILRCRCRLPPLCVWSFPSLLTLRIEAGNFVIDKRPLTFPLLKYLHLKDCQVPLMNWTMPSLETLHLVNVSTPADERPFSFDGFSHLKNITFENFPYPREEGLRVTSPTVTSLTVYSNEHTSCKIIASAPNLSYLKFQGNCVPVLSGEDGFPCLKEVNFDFNIGKDYEEEHPLFEKLISLFHAVRGTMFLTLSFKTIQVLSRFPDVLKYMCSPFGDLKSLNLRGSVPPSERMINFPDYVVIRLLSSSPGAKVFIEDRWRKIRNYNPKKNVLQWETHGYSVVNSEENSSSDTNSPASDDIPNSIEVKKKRKVSPEAHEMSNIEVNGYAMRRILQEIPPVVHRPLDNQVQSYSGTYTFSLWEGHQVNSEYVDLLTQIKETHPETFEHFTPQTDIIYTLGLNTLCSTVKAFTEDSRTSFTASLVTRYRGLFADLKKWGFNTTWPVNHLDSTAQLSFLYRISHQ